MIPKELQIPILDAKALYEALPKDKKELTMKTNFSRDITIPMKLMDIITSWENYLEYTGQKEEELLPYVNPKNDIERYQNSDLKLRYIIKLLNEGWVPNWDNTNERKYYPYFDMRTKTENGFAFRCSVCVDWGADTDVGSCFVLKTQELAEHMGRTFLAEYKDKMTL